MSVRARTVGRLASTLLTVVWAVRMIAGSLDFQSGSSASMNAKTDGWWRTRRTSSAIMEYGGVELSYSMA